MAETEQPPSLGVHTPDPGETQATINSNESANPNDKHGSESKKFVFNLQEAFLKKKQSQHKYFDKLNSKKWHFSNCCMLQFDKKNNIKAEEVFKSIKQALSETEYSSIETIGQYASTKNWTIQFNNETAFKSSLEREIVFNNLSVVLKDANEYQKPIDMNRIRPFKMVAFYRIHWLPSDFIESDIVSYIKNCAKFLTIIGITREKSLFDPKINNGIYKVKVEYDLENHKSVLDFAGLHTIGGLGSLVQLAGMPPKCLYCNAFGHVRRNCPKANSFCQKCKKSGHDTTNCNLANRTAPAKENLEDFDEEHLDENSTDQPIITENQTTDASNTVSNPIIRDEPQTNANLFVTPSSGTNAQKKTNRKSRDPNKEPNKSRSNSVSNRSRSNSTSSNKNKQTKKSNEEEKAEKIRQVAKEKADKLAKEKEQEFINANLHALLASSKNNKRVLSPEGANNPGIDENPSKVHIQGESDMDDDTDLD